MLTNDYIRKLLQLEDVIVKKVENFSGEMHVYLKTEKRIHKCPKCGAMTSKVHDYRTQIVKDIPSFAKFTILHIRKRRHVCPCCKKKFFESLTFLPKYQRTTNRLWGHILGELATERSMKSIAISNNLSPSSIARILDHVSYGINHLPSIVSIDEFKGNANGEKYQCILTNPKKRKILDILPSRKTEDLYKYFSRFDNRSNVQYVVMDMSTLFRSVARNCFPNAKIVADKYHVVRLVSWAFENVRKRVQKEFSDYRRKYFKRSRSLLLKHQKDLSPDELTQVSHMLSLSKELAYAYHLKNLFYDLVKSKDKSTAKKLLGEWFLKAEVSNLKEFSSCVNTFRIWHNEIMNIFDTGLSNGFTEGCNNRIKVIKRNAYGMRDFDRFRKRILHITA